MEIERLDNQINRLESAISHFQTGANSLDDLRPINEKITDIRESLKVLNSRHLSLNAFINDDENVSNHKTLDDFMKSYQKLNESTSHFLMHSRTLKLCHQSRAIQDIVYKNAGTPEIQEKIKFCLNKLFTTNDLMTGKIERRNELMKKQYDLKNEFHHNLYNHRALLQENEAKKNRQLQETNPDIVQVKDKINRSIAKIYTMKKLITNLIAPMSHLLMENKELIDMLSKHKEVVSLEHIIELTQKQSSSSSLQK